MRASRRPFLRSGDHVEVRGAGEILSTIDEDGTLDSLPFMPEMLSLLGRRFVVAGRAEKICDTISYTGSRRLKDTVMLHDLRCDGSGHGGCEAECRLFWKEAWLRSVARGEPTGPPPAKPRAAVEALAARLVGLAARTVQVDGRQEPRYRCQATELLRATTRLGTFDPRPYVRELTCGNVSLGRFVVVTARAALKEPLRKLGLVPEIHLKGRSDRPLEDPPRDLQPGDWVQVKSVGEIADHLDTKGRNRGLWFDREMMPYCGGTYRVRRRIRRFIDDRTGKMIEPKNSCVTLEGVVCSGDHSLRRWFCPRAIYPYWRETWLRRIDPPSPDRTT